MRPISIALVGGLVFSLAGHTGADEALRLPDEPIRSMGQPSVWKKYGGSSVSLGGAPGKGGPAAYFGVYKDLLPSVAGIFQLTHVFWDDSREDRVRSLERTRREIEAFKALVGTRDPLRPGGASLAGEVALLHREMARAFGLAAGGA